MEDEKHFKELKSKFFGIAFTDGTIQVHVLESVQEHLEEGVSMHHCVFSNAYYFKEDSLILSATIEGKRIETIEVSLRTLEGVQRPWGVQQEYGIPRADSKPCECQSRSYKPKNESDSIKYEPLNYQRYEDRD